MTETRYDGEQVTWTGKNTCFCTLCQEVFNSVAAFDAHITGKGKKRKHDYSWMPRNKKGFRVTSLREE
jgi:hypothetical protein